MASCPAIQAASTSTKPQVSMPGGIVLFDSIIRVSVSMPASTVEGGVERLVVEEAAAAVAELLREPAVDLAGRALAGAAPAIAAALLGEEGLDLVVLRPSPSARRARGRIAP